MTTQEKASMVTANSAFAPTGGCGTTTGDVRVRLAYFSRQAPQRDPLIEQARIVWAAGDDRRISAGFRDEGIAFVERLVIETGSCVLDAACRSGNLAIPAARAGARVTAIDLVPAMIDAAAARAVHERVALRFELGAVEELPYADASFDVVMSMFGVMFSPRPERAVAELARVTRPGGRVALANWSRDGFVAELLTKQHAYVSRSIDIPNPLSWGDESVIREHFPATQWDVTTTPRILRLRYPHTPTGTAELFRRAFGPIAFAFGILDEDRRARLAADLAGHWKRHQNPAARQTEVDAEYLEVIAVRRA
jgi:2-polyprenyl-3-methyl-5-hydroxy-6-metoxy-1,4-benzoquinol methylase